MNQVRLEKLLVVAVILAAQVVHAQQPGKIYRIGILSPDVSPPGLLEILREELRNSGFGDGRNAAFELRQAGGKMERLARLADDLVRLKVDVIVTVNTPGAQAAKKATAIIPIVITRVSDPVKAGLVPNLSRPGGNITGVSFIPEELSGKRIQLLKEAVPRISRVAVVWHAPNSGAGLVVQKMEPAAAQLGIQVLRAGIQDPSDVPRAIEVAVKDGAQALVLVDDAIITNLRLQILELAAKYSLPVASLFPTIAKAGGLIAYGPDAIATYRKAAQQVIRILKGAKPGDLPIEQPTTFLLVVNLKTANALGITISPTLLQRADEVVR